MKKSIKLLLALLLALTMVFALVACEETTCTDGNHDWDDGEVVTPADCVTDGQLVRTCKNCGAKSEPEAIPATGHSYALAATPWTWSQDNAKATLHLVCSANAQHTLDIDVTATSQSDTADCTTPGDVTYTAAITKAQVQAKLGAKDKLEIADESKLTATKTQSGTALGHDYQATFQWPQTYDGSTTMPTVTAKLDCSRSDSTVTEGLTVTVTEKANSRQAATCGADGSVTLVATFQYDNVDYTDEHPYTLAKTGLHNYDGQNYISEGATGHHRLCKECQQPEATSTHTLTKYTPIAGQQAHSVGCTVCDYISVQSEPCTVVDNTCTKCNETYTPEVKDTVTVYFHATGAWTAAEIKAYAWYGTDEDTVYPLEVWPGTKMTVDGTDGWYKIEFQVPQGHVNTDLYVIVNDHTKTGTGEEGSPEYTGKQTGNALVNATTIYLAGIVRKTDGEEATAYTSKEAALAAEETPAPDPEKTQYVLVGQGQEKLFGATGWEELEGNILARSGAEELRPNYYIKAVLKKNDQFKVKVLGDKDWKVSFGYTENTYYDIPETIKLTAADLFSCGSDEKGNNDNIKALHDCTVYLTIYDDEPTKMKVYVESVDDLTKPQPDPELEMEDVTIHFHLPDGWTNAYLWGWYQLDGAENGTDLFKDLSDPKCKMVNDTENEGWVVIIVQYPQGILREFKFASAPNWDDKKTENTSIEATGNVAWCSVKGNAFATKDAALNDEKIPAPTANDWFVTGSHMGNDSASTTNWEYAFGKMNGEDHYVVTLNFKNGEWFKIKKNDSTDTYWTQCISYNNTENWSITAAEGIEGTPANILGTNNDNNFVVQADCTLEFTFTPAVSGLPKVSIKITSGTIPADTEGGRYVIVGSGSLGGENGEWTEYSRNRFTYTKVAGTGSYHSLRISLKAKDEFKIKLWGQNWNDSEDFAYGCGLWFDGSEAHLKSQDGWSNLTLLGSSGSNIKVNQDCEITIKIYDSDKTSHKMCVYVHSVGAAQAPANVVALQVAVVPAGNKSGLLAA